MLTICKKAVCVFLMVLIAGAAFSCVNINRPPEKDRETNVNVGGDKGVVVEHPGGDADKDKH